MLPQVLLDVVIQSGETRHGVCGQSAEALLERSKVAEVARAGAVARRLRGVGGADPPPRGPDRSAFQLGLSSSVDCLVEPEEQMRPVGERDASGGRDAFFFEVVEFLEQTGKVDDDAVADDACCLLVEDTRGDQVELVFFTGVVVDGVAGVGAALVIGFEVGMERRRFLFVCSWGEFFFRFGFFSIPFFRS